MSVLFLKRVLVGRQWVALLLLFVGAATVQYSNVQQEGEEAADETPQKTPQVGAVGEAISVEAEGMSDAWKGLVAVLIAVNLSAFAGVYFEKVLKKEGSPSVWVRNVQLAMLGVLSAVSSVALQGKERTAVSANGPLAGFTPIVWVVVILAASGGLLTALVVKYTDNVAKGFATSIAIVGSSLLTFISGAKPFTGLFLVGGLFVLGGTLLYATTPRPVAKERVEGGEGVKI